MSNQRRGARGDRWLLGGLLALLLVAAVVGDRSGWPSLVGDEATYLMQAESLARDRDLLFEPGDLERFRTTYGHSPEVILQSGDGGRRVTFGKPLLYALAVSPWVRFLGVRGAVLANALFLGAAAWLAVIALERSGVQRAALWVAAFCFASVAFGHVFWVHPDLFLMCATAAGLAVGQLLHRDANARAAWGGWRMGGWFLVGALLAVPGATRPPYVGLLVAGALLVPGRERRRGLLALGAGALAVLVLASAGHRLASGGWSPYGGERRGFSEREGFPGVDFPRQEWSRQIEARGNTSWFEEDAVRPRLGPLLFAWNGLYFLFGRTVGVLPYFLPLLVALVAAAPGRRLWTGVAVALAVSLVFLAVRPFNFWGGAGALANRYFLPLYPLFWFGTLRGGAVGPLSAAVLAAPFLWTLWSAPTAYPLRPVGSSEAALSAHGEPERFDGYRHVAPFARRWLPVETTQRHVKAPGQRDIQHHGLWLRFLDGAVRPATPEGGALVLSTEGWGELLVGAPSSLAGVQLSPVEPRPAGFEVGGAARLARSAPGAPLRLRFAEPTARHAMWWTRESFHLYQVRLRAEPAPTGEIVFELRPAPAD